MSEITAEMLEAGVEAWHEHSCELLDDMVRAIYLAMSNSSPTDEHGPHCADYLTACRSCLDAFTRWKAGKASPIMKEDVVERVARAIYCAEADAEDVELGSQEWCERLARAAIQAQGTDEGLRSALIEAKLARCNWQKYNADQADELVYQAEKMASAIEKLEALSNSVKG